MEGLLLPISSDWEREKGSWAVHHKPSALPPLPQVHVAYEGYIAGEREWVEDKE